jgi:hypothetical protein
MLGLGLLVRAGRSLLAGPVADAGWLPGSYYRHLVLEALEENDFPGALHYLQWTDDPLLAQLLILRLRLLAREHQEQRQTLRPPGEAGAGLGTADGIRRPGPEVLWGEGPGSQEPGPPALTPISKGRQRMGRCGCGINSEGHGGQHAAASH